MLEKPSKAFTFPFLKYECEDNVSMTGFDEGQKPYELPGQHLNLCKRQHVIIVQTSVSVLCSFSDRRKPR